METEQQLPPITAVRSMVALPKTSQDDILLPTNLTGYKLLHGTSIPKAWIDMEESFSSGVPAGPARAHAQYRNDHRTTRSSHQEQSDMIKSCAVQALPCKKASRSARSCGIRWRAARVYGALLRVWAAIMIIMYLTVPTYRIHDPGSWVPS